PHARHRDDINQLIEKAQPVVQDLQKIVTHLTELSERASDPEGDFRRTLAHLERFSARLAEEPALLTLLTNDPATPQHLNDLLARAESGTGEAEATLAELRRTIARARSRLLGEDSTTSRVNRLLGDIRTKLEVLDPAVREAAASAEGMEQIRDELQITIEDTRSILKRINAIIGEEASGEVPLP
ncbi:MAG: hypothetical protein ABEJ96_07595, partial [Thiohalorhabdaceae bacterium]